MRYFSKKIVVLTATFIFLSIGDVSFSQVLIEKLDECKKIKVSLIRLQCYDRISEQGSDQKGNKTRKRLFNLGKNKNEQVPENGLEKGVNKEEVQAKESNDLESTFGKTENLLEPDEIKSRILGLFTGWSGETIFELENGQIWRKTGNGFLSANVSSPEITIKKGMFGSFTLSVEGFNSTVKVKRIK